MFSQVVEDVTITIHQAVKPLEDHITKIRESYHETRESWTGGHKKTVTKKGTYGVHDEESAGTGLLEETEIVETVEQDHKPTEESHTLITQVSYVPDEADDSVAASTGDEKEKVSVQSTTLRRTKRSGSA